MAKKTKTFEEALSRLEEIVTLMEKGELSLDDTVKLYKEGVELASFCGGKLTDAKQQVTILSVGLDGQLSEEPFDIKEEE
ncbi:MAG: exodeoxyribonuclease VII small subunit [Candidatus Metalachnospira sp.]|jgi:exodeoxyribonuclease VII small subunit